MPVAGTNSGDEVLNADAQAKLKEFFSKLEALDDEAEAIREAVKTVSADMKAAGFKAAPAKKLVKLRRKDKAKVQEENAILALYAHAVGCEDLV